jgi:hypothetical protein
MPVITTGGFAKETVEYDEKGNPIQVSYFDAKKKPTNNKEGVAYFKISYDDRGNMKEQQCFDEQKRRTSSTEKGYSKIQRRFDDYGNIEEVRVYDENDRPARDKMGGFFKLAIKHNDHGQITSQQLFDENGLPLNGALGFAKSEFAYDAKGFTIEEKYFDASGKSVRDSAQGCARLAVENNQYGQAVRQTCYDQDGKIALGKQGFAVLVLDYDQRGNRMHECELDTNKQPIMNIKGYASADYYYSAKGDVEKSCFYNDKERHLQSEVVKVVILDFLSNGEASRVGLMKGDIIEYYNNIEVSGVKQFTSLVNQPGVDLRPIIINRNGKDITLNVKPGKLGIPIDEKLVIWKVSECPLAPVKR